MIFKQWRQVLNGTKTQTRRASFPYELAVQLWKRGWKYPRSRRYRDTYEHPWYVPWDEWQEKHPILDEHIADANCILGKHVITLPVVPKRGKKAKGRTPPIREIRRERLGDISGEESMAEGIILVPYEAYMCPVCHKAYEWPQEAYACLWNCCGGRWENDQNDDTWVLGFESGSGL